MSRTPDEVIADASPDAKLRRDRDRFKARASELERLLATKTEHLSFLESADGLVVDPPAWTKALPRGKGKLHHGMPSLFLSDCHFDEIVRPDEVEGANAYNREIAVARLQRVFDSTLWVADDFFSSLTYDGFVLKLGGDMLSGIIHEELTETNEDTVLGSLDFWSDQLLGFIRGLRDHFKRVHVWGVVGNHGRLTRKPRAKRRVRDNLDWLFYRILAKATRDDSRITWTIPESADVDVEVYNTRIRLTHGDQFRGGSGIAGMMSPLMLGSHRKAQRQMSLGKPFEWLVMGHWHQYMHGLGLIVNGCLKGYDEFAYVSNFKPERPSQAFFIITPENGVTFGAPIFATPASLQATRKLEKW